MLFALSPTFVADTKVIFGSNFVASSKQWRAWRERRDDLNISSFLDEIKSIFHSFYRVIIW